MAQAVISSCHFLSSQQFQFSAVPQTVSRNIQLNSRVPSVPAGLKLCSGTGFLSQRPELKYFSQQRRQVLQEREPEALMKALRFYWSERHTSQQSTLHSGKHCTALALRLSHPNRLQLPISRGSRSPHFTPPPPHPPPASAFLTSQEAVLLIPAP